MKKFILLFLLCLSAGSPAISQTIRPFPIPSYNVMIDGSYALFEENSGPGV